MRISVYNLFLLGITLMALPAGAQQNDWNHPSTQQQNETRDFSKDVKDNVNDIGTTEDNVMQGQPGYTVSSPVDKSQVQDATQKGAEVFDSVTSQFR